MKKGTVIYQIILDASYSMLSAREATLATMNEHIRMVQRLEEGDEKIRFMMGINDFSSDIRVLSSVKPAEKVAPIQLSEYVLRDTTALFDAIGETTRSLEKRFSKELQKGKAKILVMILTDGIENCSRKWNIQAIAERLQALESTGMWSFDFVGADFNVETLESHFGLKNATYRHASKSDFSKFEYASGKIVAEYSKSYSEELTDDDNANE